MCVEKGEAKYSKSFRIVARPGEVSNLTLSVLIDT